MDKLHRGLERITKAISALSSIALTLMMLITVANILSRLFSNTPVLGAYELVCYLSLTMVCFNLADAELGSQMVAVTFIEEWFSPKIVNIVYTLLDLMASVFFVYLSYHIFMNVIKRYENGSVSDNLYIPEWIPFSILFVGIALLSLIFIFKMVFNIWNHKNLSPRKISLQNDSAQSQQ